MKVTNALNVLALCGFALAVPRNNVQTLRQRQAASSCSCPSDVTITETAIGTVTQADTTTITTDAGLTLVTANQRIDDVTVTRTETVLADETATTTRIEGRTTITTTASVVTYTSTFTNPSSTITTCIASAFKRKRQASSDAAVATSTPSTTTITTNFGSPTALPNTCVCRLVSAFTPFSSSSTSPTNACSCSSVQTTTTTFSSIITTTAITTIVISNYETSTITPATTSTIFSDVTVESTSTHTTISTQPRVTTTTYRTTVSVTTTVASTLVSCPTADLSCDNAGIRWAIYLNTNSAGANNTNRDSTYSSFNPTIFKTRTPMYQNITYTLGGFRYPAAEPVYIPFYGSPRTFESDYITINHAGYVFAQITGTYTFSISQSDDITLLWVGANAYSGWTRANANIVNPYGAGTSTYRVNFVAGNYYPFRIVFGNAQQAIIYQASLTAPDGTVILTSNSKKSPYLVQNSCDNIAAPSFPAFGSET